MARSSFDVWVCEWVVWLEFNSCASGRVWTTDSAVHLWKLIIQMLEESASCSGRYVQKKKSTNIWPVACLFGYYFVPFSKAIQHWCTTSTRQRLSFIIHASSTQRALFCSDWNTLKYLLLSGTKFPPQTQLCHVSLCLRRARERLTAIDLALIKRRNVALRSSHNKKKKDMTNDNKTRHKKRERCRQSTIWVNINYLQSKIGQLKQSEWLALIRLPSPRLLLW